MAVPDATRKSPRPVPTTGMRGGLGRTLLTAFLMLVIGSLILVSYPAFDRVRSDQQQRAFERLTVIADLVSTELDAWIAEETSSLVSISGDSSVKKLVASLSKDFEATHEGENSAPYPDGAPYLDGAPLRNSVAVAHYQNFESIWLFEAYSGRTWPLMSASSVPVQSEAAPFGQAAPFGNGMPGQPLSPPLAQLTVSHEGLAQLSIIVPVTQGAAQVFYLVGQSNLPKHFARERLSGSSGYNERLYLLSRSGRLFSLDGRELIGASPSPVAQTDQDGQSMYTNHEGMPVFGAYRWLHHMNCALIAEKDQASAFAASDQFAASLIAAIMGVALLTTIIAAVVTRQLTRPIVRLTEVALLMAEGDLSQRVQIDRRDEIGILARVFNKMANDLGELYTGLEKKVAERTSELELAKEQIQYHAWQLSISAEIGRLTTSILDLDKLLERAAHLVRDAFQLDHVGIYLLGSSNQVAILRKNVGRAVPLHEQQIHIGGTHPVSRAIAGRIAHSIVPVGDSGSSDEMCHKLALPLALGITVIGALDITNHDAAEFSESDQTVLQTLADQLSIAIQNARAYGYEREVVDELREVDRLRGQFLSRISHEMATHLNSIIGFSQMMLKGIEGPLTELQTNDLKVIRQSGQQLLQLLSDIHDLANLEVGAIELDRAPVDVTSLVGDLETTLISTISDVHLQIDMQTQPPVPIIMADADRLRQVLTNLVITAAEMSRGKTITMHVKQLEEQVHLVISAPAANEVARSHSDIHLALSRRLIELHGGRLQIAEHASGEIVFAFNIPITPQTVSALPPGAASRSNGDNKAYDKRSAG